LCFSILQFSAGIDAQSEAAVGCTTIINQLWIYYLNLLMISNKGVEIVSSRY
jgi:hypothetical protein